MPLKTAAYIGGRQKGFGVEQFLKHMIRLDIWSPHYRKAYPAISPDILGWACMGVGNITTFDIQYAALYMLYVKGLSDAYVTEH